MFNSVELNFIKECVENEIESYSQQAQASPPNSDEANEFFSDTMVLKNIIHKVNGMKGFRPNPDKNKMATEAE